MERSGKALLCLALLVASTQCTKADIGGFFSDLGNSLKDAGNTIKGGTETAFQVVKNNTVDAANATGDAFKEAGNAIADGAKTAYNKTVNIATQQWDKTKRQINTLEGVFQDVGQSLNKTVFDFKDSALKDLRSVSDDITAAADQIKNTTVRVVSDGVSGVVSFGNATWRALDVDSASTGAAAAVPILAPTAPVQVVGVDATSAESVRSVVRQNSTAAFTQYAQSIVVAVAEGRSANVSAAVADVIGSENPGNKSEVSLGLGKAFGIAMIAAGNAAVQRAAPVNASLVAEAYIAGLQDTVSNCTALTQTNLPPDSQAWFQFYADRCCGSVTDALAKMSLIMQQVPDQAASDAWFGTLGSSYEYGRTPVFNLARCLAADKSIVKVEAS